GPVIRGHGFPPERGYAVAAVGGVAVAPGDRVDDVLVGVDGAHEVLGVIGDRDHAGGGRVDGDAKRCADVGGGGKCFGAVDARGPAVARIGGGSGSCDQIDVVGDRCRDAVSTGRAREDHAYARVALVGDQQIPARIERDVVRRVDLGVVVRE